MERSFFQALVRYCSHCLLAAALTSACVKLPRRTHIVSENVSSRPTQTTDSQPLLSINRASREELEKLPGIGPALAARIVEHREHHGPFRRVEHLMLVRGISERRFRELRPFITTE